MGIRLGKGMCLSEVCDEGWGLRKRIKMSDSRWVAGDICCIRGFHMGNLLGCKMVVRR